MYLNRIEAAQALEERLLQHKGENGVVLAVPRGGVPIGYPIALALGFPLDIILTKKIGHPKNPELAIGAVSQLGAVVDPDFGVSEEYIKDEIARLRQQLRKNYQRYIGENYKPIELSGKTVILVDDGIATGKTMVATIDLLRHSKPGKIVVAVPVAPPNTVEKLQRLVDRIVCPLIPNNFYAVGQFYQDFEQVSDEEVIALLQEGNKIETNPNNIHH